MISAARTVVVGLGNPLLGDDAAGLLVARALAPLGSAELTILETSRAGLSLLDLIDGFARAILVDSIVSGREAPGFIWRLSPDALPAGRTLATSHEIDLGTALRLGRELGFAMPGQVDIWAIEANDVYTVGAPLDQRVALAIATCARGIAAELGLNADQSLQLGQQLFISEMTPLDRR